MIPHPILKNIRSILIFTGFWIIFIIFAFIFLYTRTALSIEATLFNSFILGLSSALMGIAIWYAVLYSFPEKVGMINTLVNHLITAIILISFQVIVIISLNKYLFPEIDFQFISGKIFRIILPNIFFYIAFVLGYYAYLYRINLQEKKREEERLSRMVKEAELNLLKSQLNPHFLFNSLNSISALTLTDPKKAQEMIILLSDFLRYSLARDGRQLSTLTIELHNIQRYLQIEKIRFGSRVQYEFNVEPQAYSCTLPVMILQPVFENAIKHGVNESVDTVNIELKAITENNLLIITIQNPYDPSAPSKKGSGLGLKNIEERLRLIYHNEGLLKYKKENNIFEVKLIIPQ